MKNPDKVIMGKNSRKQGKAFELKVRHDLEKKGWIVERWSNNVDLEKGLLISAKHTFNPFTKAMSAGNGFPDFLAICEPEFLNIKPQNVDGCSSKLMSIQLIECKMNGKLDKIEKDKIEWIKNNLKIPVIIAKKGERGVIYENI